VTNTKKLGLRSKISATTTDLGLGLMTLTAMEAVTLNDQLTVSTAIVTATDITMVLKHKELASRTKDRHPLHRRSR